MRAATDCCTTIGEREGTSPILVAAMSSSMRWAFCRCFSLSSSCSRFFSALSALLRDTSSSSNAASASSLRRPCSSTRRCRWT